MTRLLRMTMSVFALLAMLSATGTAQSWSPLKLKEKFNFHGIGYPFITNTVWTDSAKVSGADSVFYLNRIVTGCDTCPNGYRLAGQPGIMKGRMVRKPGGIYNFREPGSTVIQSLAAPGDTWTYDSLSGVLAHVVSAGVATVFGQPDSVKAIRLTTGDTIRLSKSFGLLQAVPGDANNNIYQLAGIEGRNVGQIVPRFREIYSFGIGDIFQYKGHSMSYSVPYGGGIGYLEKIQILSKDSTAGHYAYNTLRYYCSWSLTVQGIPYDTSHVYEYGTLEFTDSVNHLANYYPQQIVENPIDPGMAGSTTCYFKVTDDANQVYTKWIGSYNFCDDHATYVHGSLMTPPLPHDVLTPGMIDVFLDVFQPGLGNTSYTLKYFESEVQRDLIGYIKNGDTTGYIVPDEMILQGISALTTQNLTLFPNPAEDHIVLPKSAVSAESMVEILDLSGSLVLKTVAARQIDISGLLPGCYFLVLKDPLHGPAQTGQFIRR